MPDPTRFVPLVSYAGEAPRSYRPTPLSRRWPAKGAIDVLDYALDCRDSNDSIADYSVAVSDAALQLKRDAHDGGLLFVWLAGGAPGGDYTVTWSIAFASGQSIVVPVSLAVVASGAAPAPSPPILAVRPDEATPLLARSGAAILPSDGALSAGAIGAVDA